MSDITYLAASNATSDLSGVSKQRSLCSECRKLHFSASDFFLPKGKGDKGPFILCTRPWSVFRDATDCSLCQLIVFAVRAASEERLIQEAPFQCQLIFCLLETEKVVVDLDMNAAKDAVMAIKFVAQYSWTSVSDFLIPLQSEDYPGAFPGRVIQPDQIDVKQVHQWLHQCKTKHAGTCQEPNTPVSDRLRASILVIDVDDQCLKILPDNGRYIALSYVWGGVEQVETTMSNLQHFAVAGALSQIAQDIPITIRDAMEFVKQLGEKFLWVDALCIIQDDSCTKKPMIGHMNFIYANAYATLFAASGDNANAGLPGVSPFSRRMNQPMATLADGLTFIYPTPFEVIKKSVWATRGWTYQEYFCSPRRLIFTPGQLIYRCNTVRWQEDLAIEHMTPFRAIFQLHHGGKGPYWEPPNWPYKWTLLTYTKYVTTYLDRNLTHDSDILDAFAGIINVARDGGLPTLHGLLQQYFGPDMLWKHSRWASRRPGFPSWSWAGWKGTIFMQNYGDLLTGPQLQEKSWIHWYIYDEKEANFVLFNSGHIAALEEILSKGDNSLDTSSTAIGDNRQIPRASASSDTTKWDSTVALLLSQLSLNSADEALTPRLTPSAASRIPNLDKSTLLFRTLTAYLTISALKPNGQKPCTPYTDPSPLPSTPSLYLYTTSGIHVGTAWVSSEDMYNEILKNDEQHNDRPSIEVIVLSGSGTGDWRTRNENLTRNEYMEELMRAGINEKDWNSQYKIRTEYESLIGGLYDRMINERASGPTEDPCAQFPSDFWEILSTRASLEIAESGKFPGHTAADLQHAIDALKAGKFLGNIMEYFERNKENFGRGMFMDFSVRFLQILLIGKLGVLDNNGSAGAKERIGIGEIREDKLAAIDGLALRDVLLR